MRFVIFFIIILVGHHYVCAQEVKEFFDSGELERVYCLKDSLKHGRLVTYYKSGAVKRTGRFRFGNPIGVWDSYSESGNLLVRIYYDRKGNVKKTLNINPARR